MVLSNVPLSFEAGTKSATIISAPTNSAQCSIADLALYRLPNNIRIESVEFENSILQCVKNNLTCRCKNADCDLARELLLSAEDDAIDCPDTAVSNNSDTNSSSVQRQFFVCIESNRLLLTSSSWPTIADNGLVNCDGDGIDFTRANVCLQTCFSEIVLCYVSIQLPNMIIWLLSSIPHKIVKNDRVTTTSTTATNATTIATNCSSPTRQKSLFALVWQCMSENDVVRLRQMYRHLRTTKKPRSSPLLSITGRNDHLVIANELKCFDHSMSQQQQQQQINSMNRGQKIPFSAKSMAAQHILSRQRHPAKLIQESHYIARILPAAIGHLQLNPSIDRNLSHKSSKFYAVRQFPVQSESEFDTTQISSYLSQNDKATNGGGAGSKARARSRSVECQPRRRFRVLHKPVSDDLEILIPSSRCNIDSEHRSESDKRTRTHDKEKKTTVTKNYQDLLNSEGSSISGESSSGEFVASSLEYEYPHRDLTTKSSKTTSKNMTTTTAITAVSSATATVIATAAASSTITAPVVIKSVLKKSSSYFDGQVTPTNVHFAATRGSSGSAFFLDGAIFPNDRNAVPSNFAFEHHHQRLHHHHQHNRTKHQQSHPSSGNNVRACAGNYGSNGGKKNVTFSAYATIQVVDN